MSVLVLVIEDNSDNLELMSYLLAAFGYTPLLAGDGEAGLRAALEKTPGLIICDLQLPGMDGYEVARQLKSHPVLRRIPLVAVTAYAMVGDRDKAIAAGFDGYITKPINPETFIAQMEVYLPLRQPGVTLTAHAPAAEGVPAVSVQGHTILVVDNLPVNLQLARSVLEPSGFQVVTAEDMEEGLALARQVRCDLILSDVCMTRGNGYELVSAVKNDPQLRDIPVILITSTMMSEKDRVRGLALGAARFLFRPIDPITLLLEIQSCLQQRKGP